MEEVKQDRIYIYALIFPNGKWYVGRTVDFGRRMSRHKYNSKRNAVPVSAAIREFGWDNVERRVILVCSKDMGDYHERVVIKVHGSLAPGGYNMETGGRRNHRASNESLDRMSKSQKGRIISDEHRFKLSEAGRNRKQSKETIAKRIASNTGQRRTDATRQKMSEAQKKRWQRRKELMLE